jgi:hypothetical protein
MWACSVCVSCIMFSFPRRYIQAFTPQ